jgi:hypothetical protein
MVASCATSSDNSSETTKVHLAVQRLTFHQILAFFPDITQETLSEKLLEPDSVGVALYADDDPATAVPGFTHIWAVFGPDPTPDPEGIGGRIDGHDTLTGRRFEPVGYYLKPELPAPVG